MNLKDSFIRIWGSKGQIIEGIRNSIFRQEHIEEVAAARLQICKTNVCQSYDTSGAGCAMPGTQPCCNINNGGCGCSLYFATRSMTKSCPKQFWPAELTEEEDKELNKALINAQTAKS